jgi:hypothetical protein
VCDTCTPPECNCPASIRETAGMPFAEQLARIIGTFTPADAALFLAGVRFAEGARTYGDKLFHIPTPRLRFEALQEEADRIVYEAELAARGEHV